MAGAAAGAGEGPDGARREFEGEVASYVQQRLAEGESPGEAARHVTREANRAARAARAEAEEREMEASLERMREARPLMGPLREELDKHRKKYLEAQATAEREAENPRNESRVRWTHTCSALGYRAMARLTMLDRQVVDHQIAIMTLADLVAKMKELGANDTADAMQEQLEKELDRLEKTRRRRRAMADRIRGDPLGGYAPTFFDKAQYDELHARVATMEQTRRQYSDVGKLMKRYVEVRLSHMRLCGQLSGHLPLQRRGRRNRGGGGGQPEGVVEGEAEREPHPPSKKAQRRITEQLRARWSLARRLELQLEDALAQARDAAGGQLPDDYFLAEEGAGDGAGTTVAEDVEG